MSTRQDEGLSIAIAADEDVACLVRPWRHLGRRALSVVVKATFSMNPSGTMALGPVAEVVTEDRTFGNHPTKSVEAAAESAPFLGKCDVLLQGSAHGGGRPSTAARLAVFRDRTPLFDRTLHVFGERDAAGVPGPFDKVALTYERAWGGPGMEANPVGSRRPRVVDPRDPQKPACFGPVSRFWPARKGLLGQRDVSSLFGAPGRFGEVPEGLSWGYFQAAPPEQQIEYLRGDEWVVLDGMSAVHPRVEARLPGARAVARLRGAGGEVPVALVADMLVIDADRLVCSVVWRGRWDVPADAAGLSRVEVAAGLELPGKVVVWERLWPKLLVAAPAAPVAGEATDATIAAPAGGAGEATMGLTPWDQAQKSARPVAPFAVTTPGSVPVRTLEATPWSGGAPAPMPAAPVGEMTLELGATRPVQPAPVLLGLPVSEPLPAVPAPAPVALEVAPPATLPSPSPSPSPSPAAPVQLAPVPEPAPPAPPPPPPPPEIAQLRSAGASEEALAAMKRLLGG